MGTKVEVLLLFIVLFVVASLVSRALRRRAERRVEEQRREYDRAVAAGEIEPDVVSPFEMPPFGPTVGIRLDELARETDGMSPADLKSLCQEAALAAMARDGETPAVTHEDFREALNRLRDPSPHPSYV